MSVPGYAALAHLEPEPLSPILGAAGDQEMGLLRCRGLDEVLFVQVLGRPHPADTLLTPAGRMEALEAHMVSDCILLASSALWVHAGGEPPHRLMVCVPGQERSRWRDHSIHRVRLPRTDVVEVAGRRCATLARAAVDVARTAPPVEAVAAILTARATGVSRVGLHLALSHCRGASATGRPRAARIIEALMPAPGSPAPQGSVARPPH